MQIKIVLPQDFSSSVPLLLLLEFPPAADIPAVQLNFQNNTATVTLSDDTLTAINGGSLQVTGSGKVLARIAMPMAGTALAKVGRQVVLPAEKLLDIVPANTPVVVPTQLSSPVATKPTPPASTASKSDSKSKGATPQAAPSKSASPSAEEETEVLMTAADHDAELARKVAQENAVKEASARAKGMQTLGITVLVVALIGALLFFLKDSPVRESAGGDAAFSFDLKTAYASGAGIPLFAQVMLVITGASVLIALIDRGIKQQFPDFLASLLAYVLYVLSGLYKDRQDSLLPLGFGLMYYTAVTNGVDLTSPGMFWLLNASTLSLLLFGGPILDWLFPTGKVVVMGLWSLFEKGGTAGVSPIPSLLVLGFLLIAALHFFLDVKGTFVKGKTAAEVKDSFVFSGLFGVGFLIILIAVSAMQWTTSTFVLSLVVFVLLLLLCAMIPFLSHFALYSAESGGFNRVSDGKTVTLAQLDGIMQGGVWVTTILFLIS